jgi:RNA polymerase sigma factor (sigma-70 family)
MSDEEKGAKFTRLVSEHSRALLRYSMRRLSDIASCEDVVAETFLIAWRRWNDLPPPNRELAWLYGIAFRVLSNQRRSRDRRDRLSTRLSMERDPGGEGTDQVDTGSLLRALGELRSHDRELLEFVYWEKLTYRDIALVFGISENAVGIRITRAKRNLKTLLSPSHNEIPCLTSFREESER